MAEQPEKKKTRKKKGATPAKVPGQGARTAAAKKRAADQALEKANAARLAQIVNLMIAGMSLADIGASIGASAEEVDRLLQRDAARYVRNQPQLRVYVRNWISERYTKMLDADWDQATDPNGKDKLEHQDRVFRILDGMRKLHGADAPTQTEVTVDAAPEAVEKLVQALSEQSGLGFDTSIFDVVDAEVVHDSAQEAPARTLEAGQSMERHVAEGEEDDL